MIKQLLSKLEKNKALIGVVGLGYVGLPLVREFTRGGAKVVGFDVDPGKVKALMAGRSYIEHIPSATVKQMLRGGRFETCDRGDTTFLIVPSPGKPGLALP